MIHLRPIVLEDRELVFSWRNDPQVYKYLFNAQSVDWDSHCIWFDKVLTNPKVLFLMGLVDKTPFGTVRFDFAEDLNEAEVGIYVAPEFFGKNLGSSLLEAGEAEAKRKAPKLRLIKAKVLTNNEKSHKLFQRLNYSDSSNKNDSYVMYTKRVEK